MQTGVPKSFSILRLGAGNRKSELTVAVIEAVFNVKAVLFIKSAAILTAAISDPQAVFLGHAVLLFTHLTEIINNGIPVVWCCVRCEDRIC